MSFQELSRAAAWAVSRPPRSPQIGPATSQDGKIRSEICKGRPTKAKEAANKAAAPPTAEAGDGTNEERGEEDGGGRPRREPDPARGPSGAASPLAKGPSRYGAAATAAAAVEPAEATVMSPGGGGPHKKKVRALLKKVRAIDDLKMRLAGGEKLEDNQMQKIGTEDVVRRELEGLGYTG